jgi:hypothetical protein
MAFGAGMWPPTPTNLAFGSIGYSDRAGGLVLAASPDRVLSPKWALQLGVSPYPDAPIDLAGAKGIPGLP